MSTTERYALIGAGPAGLAAARNLQKHGIVFDGFEAADEVGGQWHVGHPRSAVRSSTFLLDSRASTGFNGYPLPEDGLPFAGQPTVHQHLRDIAGQFELHAHYRFGITVERLAPVEGGWRLLAHGADGAHVDAIYRGVIIATGLFSEPVLPSLRGRPGIEVVHSASIKDPRRLAGQRVLIIGGGNSAAELAVEAVPHAAQVDLSWRRGYHIVPKLMFGRPADQVLQRRHLPASLKQSLDGRLLRWFAGDLEAIGLPRPDHQVHELPFIVNTRLLHHLYHGQVKVRSAIAQVEGATVEFERGAPVDYDLIVAATGFRPGLSFIDPIHLDAAGGDPGLYLHIFPPAHENLFVLGLVDGLALGWQTFYEQAELVAAVIHAQRAAPEHAETLRARIRGQWPELNGGLRFLPQPRMHHRVDVATYRAALAGHLQEVTAG